MKDIIKSLCLILTVCFLLFGAAACVSSNDVHSDESGPDDQTSDGEVVINFWNPITGPDAGYMQTLIKNFNDVNKGRIQVKSNSRAEDAHYDKITASFTDKSTADLCLIHQSRIAFFQRQGVLRDMTELLASKNIGKSQYVGTTWESCEFDGKMYGLPYDILPTVLFYNRDLIPEGYTEAEILDPDFTLDKMLQMMSAAYKDARRNDDKIYGMSFNYSYTEAMFLSFLNQQGVKAVDASDPVHPTFASSEGYAAADAVRSIPFAKSAEGIKVSSDTGSDHLDIYKQGRALFTIDGIWSAPGAQEVNTGVALLPKINSGVDRKVCGDGHVFAMFTNKSQSDKKDAAIAEFIDYLINGTAEVTINGEKRQISSYAYWCAGGKVAAKNITDDAFYSEELEWGYLSSMLDRIVPPVKVYTYKSITAPIGVYVAQLAEGTEADVQKAVNHAASDAQSAASRLK